MKIFLCIIISKKNWRFQRKLLNSLNTLKKSQHHKLNIIFITQRQNIFFVNFVKKKLSNNIEYKILESGVLSGQKYLLAINIFLGIINF